METDELEQYLDALKREECYRVDEVLKESPHEVTQLVTFVGSNGAGQGPFVRKYIKRETGMGSVYERIRQAQAAGKRFKHVPAILESYSNGEDLVVVMEHVRGETLQDYVYRNDPSVGLARRVFPMLCDAVCELHEEFDPPIIHRDLKPSNVVLSDGGLTLIDFGISREFRDGADADTHRFGTREFAPPEQFGFGQTTVRSDVYALGMLLYYCLTETIPTAAVREAGFADARIPEQLRQVIAQATALDPAGRFASAHALKAAFLASSGQAAPSSAPVGAPSRRPVGDGGNAGSEFRPSALSWMRNGAVLVAMAFFLVVVWSGIFNPPPSNVGKPLWYNILTYAVFGTAFVVSCAYTLLDLRSLALYNPVFSKVKRWHLWVATAVVLLVAATIAFILDPTASVS